MSDLIMISTLAFIIGVAIQRGTTCAVLAVEELLRHRRWDRFLGFFECGLWAALVFMLLGDGQSHAPAFSEWGRLLAGAVFFGIGAMINSGCSFGTIGRIGSGRFDYFFTIAAAWIGIRAAHALDPVIGDQVSRHEGAGLTPLVAVGLLVFFMAARWFSRKRAVRMFFRLGAVMAVIGSVGAVIGFLYQPWPWMKSLDHLPHIDMLTAAGLASLIAGSIAHGVYFRRFSFGGFTPFEILRRIAGGLLMGAGASFIPGGNDTLILSGVPQGDIRAIAAYLLMLAVIAVLVKAVDMTQKEG